MQIIGVGHVYSLEHLPEYAKATRANLATHGLADWATVLDAPLRPHVLDGKEWQWYSTNLLPRADIDMIVIDGPPEDTGPLARYPAGPLLFNQLASSSAIFIDDAIRLDERLIVDTWTKEFPYLQRQDRHCERGCTLLLKNRSQPTQA